MKILCLSTYPIENPMHGGQHRLSNIVAELQAAGHEVCSAGVLGSPTYPPSPCFVAGPTPDDMVEVLEQNGMMEDWVISELFAKDETYFKTLADCITMVPDAIFVEQPWLFRFAERLNSERFAGHARLLYGSQNVEFHLKEAILTRYYSQKHVAECTAKVHQCELHAVGRAERMFCVSRNDVDWARNLAALPPVLAANGVADRKASMADVIAANRITHGHKFALYCASAHPPNMEGFFDIFGEGAGCFPPEGRMVVAGGAGRSIAIDLRLARTGSLQQQFIDAGQVSESVLQGLLATAHVIVLPITSGGGTNLKTAEALWSGRHVVATPTAMRGFEQFANGHGIHVAEQPVEFVNAVRDAFLQPNLQISRNDRNERSVVLWENTLAQMIATIDAMEMAA